MAKFGSLITKEIPVLLEFYMLVSTSDDSKAILETVAAALGDKATVIRINIDDNTALAKALRIKTNPTYMIYKNGEMLWRQSENHDANTLINAVSNYF